MWPVLLQFLPVVAFLALGYGVGSWRERRHLRSLGLREAAMGDIQVCNLKRVPDPETITNALLVSGDAVIATDYFKSFAASLRNIVGGEMRTYETLMVRARREATLRMLERARAAGAVEVWNVRYETSNIRSSSNRRRAAVSVEVFAYGTAVVRG